MAEKIKAVAQGRRIRRRQPVYTIESERGVVPAARDYFGGLFLQAIARREGFGHAAGKSRLSQPESRFGRGVLMLLIMQGSGVDQIDDPILFGFDDDEPRRRSIKALPGNSSEFHICHLRLSKDVRATGTDTVIERVNLPNTTSRRAARHGSDIWKRSVLQLIKPLP
ncbi:MAG: hypothetical protein ACTHLU_04375 [Novosphingobium sp.]